MDGPRLLTRQQRLRVARNGLIFWLIITAIVLYAWCAPASAQAPRGRLYAGLETAFVGLQAADTASTLVALQRGASEGNVLMRLPPPAFVAVKASGTVLTVWLTRRLAREHKVAAVVLLACLDSVYAVVVTRNVRLAR